MARNSSIFNSEDMKRFLGQTLLALLLLTAICRGLTCIAPAGWVDEDMEGKLAHLAEVQRGERPYNHVLIGSSHIYRQINPGVLDRAAGRGGLALRSFNLGIPSMANPESYQLAERLIDGASPSGPLQFITLEMTNPSAKLHLDNPLIARNTHFMNLQAFFYFLHNDAGSLRMRTSNAFQYLQMLIASQFHIGHLRLLTALVTTGTATPKDPLWLNDAGFLSLDREMREKGMHIYRHERFQRKKAEGFNFDDLKASWAQAATWTWDRSSPRPNQAHLTRMLAMIERAREKGITLRFVITPPFGAYKHFLATAGALPAGHFVQAADPSDLPPPIIEPDMFFDKDHFNEAGAALYSEAFAGIWLAELLE
jgi:hypothetical protein